MSKKIIFLMCLLMAMVWIAGCACQGARPRPAIAAPPPVGNPPPPPPPPPPPVIQPKVEAPVPSKKLKKRVIKEKKPVDQETQ